MSEKLRKYQTREGVFKMVIDDGKGKVLELVLGSHVFVREGDNHEICRDWFEIDPRIQKKFEKIHSSLEQCLGEAVGSYIRTG